MRDPEVLHAAVAIDVEALLRRADDLEGFVLPAECAPSEDNAGVEPYSGTLPWGDDSDICNDSGFGCSIGARPREIVLGLQGLVALFGLGFMMRRRRATRE